MEFISNIKIFLQTFSPISSTSSHTTISFHFNPFPKPDADKADLVVVNKQEAVVISAFYFPHDGQEVGNVIVKQAGIFLKHVLVNGAIAEWKYENGVHVRSDGLAHRSNMLRQNK